MADNEIKKPPVEAVEKVFDVLQYELIDFQRELQAEIENQSRRNERTGE